MSNEIEQAAEVEATEEEDVELTPEEIYENYKENLKNSYPRAYDLLVSNKAMIKYKDMTSEDLENVFNAVIKMGEELVKENK